MSTFCITSPLAWVHPWPSTFSRISTLVFFTGWELGSQFMDLKVSEAERNESFSWNDIVHLWEIILLYLVVVCSLLALLSVWFLLCFAIESPVTLRLPSTTRVIEAGLELLLFLPSRVRTASRHRHAQLCQSAYLLCLRFWGAAGDSHLTHSRQMFCWTTTWVLKFLFIIFLRKKKVFSFT